MNSVDRILSLLKERDIRASQLARETGLSSGLISQWKKGLQTPSAKSLQKIADYFDVSVDFLLTGEEPKKSSEPQQWSKLEGELDINPNDIQFAFSGPVEEEITEKEKQDVINAYRLMKRLQKIQQAKEDLKRKEGEKGGQT